MLSPGIPTPPFGTVTEASPEEPLSTAPDNCGPDKGTGSSVARQIGAARPTAAPATPELATGRIGIDKGTPPSCVLGCELPPAISASSERAGSATPASADVTGTDCGIATTGETNSK